jgi:hypothetical protein
MKYLPFVAGLFAGIYFISLNVTGKHFEFFPGDLIDGRFNNYLLEHVYRFFTGKESSFWDAPFMFPEEKVITYSDNLLGSAPFYCVFRLLGADRETSFQLWYLLVTTLNYAAAYLLLNHVFRNRYAAVCGAMVFAFSMALHSQVGHAQTFPRYGIPLAFLMLLKFHETLKPRHFSGALFFLAYQMYCGIYLGFLLAVPFFIFVLSGAFSQWPRIKLRLKERRWILQLLGAALVNLLFLLPLLIPYFERARQTGFYPYENVLSSIPTIKSYLFSWRGSLFWEPLNEMCISYPAFWDHEIFAGGIATLAFVVVLVLMLLGWGSKKIAGRVAMSSETKLIMISGLITFIIFLRIGDFSLYRIIYAVPGFGSMRALQRVINIELLFFAIAVSFLVRGITSRKEPLSVLITCVLAGLIVADNYIQPGFIHQREKAASQQRINDLVAKMREIPVDRIVSYEPDSMATAPMDYQLDAMMASQLLGLTTLNGYSATSPGGYGPYWVNPNEANRKIWLERKGRLNAPIAVIK